MQTVLTVFHKISAGPKKRILFLALLLFAAGHLATYFGGGLGRGSDIAGKDRYEASGTELRLKGAVFSSKFANYYTVKALTPEPEIEITARPDLVWAMLNFTIENIDPDKAVVHGAALSELQKLKRGIRFSMRVGSRKKINLRIEQETQPLSFLVYGDSQGSDSPFSNSRGSFFVWEKITSLARARKPAFILALGDLVHSGKYYQYRRLNRQIRKIKKIPFLPVPGNHDVKNNGRSFWKHLFGPEYSSFIFEECGFVLVDNASDALGEEQFLWLEKKLEDLRGRKFFVFMHKPIFDPRPGQNYVMENETDRLRLLSLIEKYRPQTVFSGHIHGYADFVKNGIRYIISGGGGAHLRMDDGFYHAVLVTAKEGAFEYEVLKVRALPPLSWTLGVLANLLFLFGIFLFYRRRRV